MSNFSKKAIFLGGLTAIIIVVFVAGIYLGYNERPEAKKIMGLLGKDAPPQLAQFDFGPFWKTWNVIETKYVAPNEINRQQMIWGAIQGLAASLGDPYSVFFPPQEAELFQTSVRGDFEGVGMEIGIKDKVLTVIAPLKNSPAAKAGIKAGDKIIKINDTLTADLTIEKAVTMIRGQKGTKVRLSVMRDDSSDPLTFELLRDIVEIPVLDAEKKPDGVFVITLYNFSARSADEFRAALREMVASGGSRLILDLRGNPGGYLESAVDIASWFLPTGKVVTKEKLNMGEGDVFRSKGYNIFNKLPMVILIDKGSASASEILAGALQEYGVAKLVGEQSYGKGSVQQLFDITDKSSLKLTIAQWLTPNGKSISKEGLKPDIEIKLTEKDKTDKQMEKAIEVVKSL